MIARPGDIQQGSIPARSNAKRYWTVADLLIWTEQHFKKLGLATPRLDAELLLAQAMGTSRLELYTGYRKVVESDERARFRSLVERRTKREPVAYILGTREFYSLAFEVNPAVLIPRPETEHLVDRVLAELKNQAEAAPEPAPLKILDLGTGSGNIAIALAVQLPAAEVTAVDLSAEALEVARRNARRHQVEARLKFIQGDLFATWKALFTPETALLTPGTAPFTPGTAPFTPGTAEPELFHAIVSNPPYVAVSEYPALMRDVHDYEPALALVDQKAGTGLGFYQAIIKAARRFLSPRGLLALEVGDTQARRVEKLLRDDGWERVHITSDYGGIPRVITSENNSSPGS